MTQESLQERFDRQVAENMRLEREAIQRRWEYLRQPDTHDEWKRLNDQPAS
jgi:hypothetical protein